LTPSLFLYSRRWLEYLLLGAGFFCLAIAFRQFARYEVFELTPQSLAVSNAHLHKPTPAAPARILGRLEIARLALSVDVLEGDTNENLALGAAHLTDTAPLGSNGNSAIAGHRDLAFRSLGAIRVGDKIKVHAATELTYRVTRTSIVTPADTSALASDGRPRLTLITCYPFHFIGSAPRRFIVEADLQ
jgi:LPXTG-site transpeptidase (sortase) family protein